MQNPLSISSEMELRSLQHSSSPLTNLPTSLLFRTNCAKRSHLYDRFVKFSNPTKYPGARTFQKPHIKAHLSSGVTRFSSSIVEATTENVDSKDENVVFVAGATGKVGSRTVRELLKLGYQVRAGVRSAQRAESLVQSVKQMKVDTDATGGRKPIEMLEIVVCDLEKPGQIVPALGRASVVICCIGASEKEIFDVTGPYRIDYLATKYLIDAATVAKVNHFILVTSLGTNKFGFPAAILNLFWGVLCWKRKAEEALIASGLPYTIVRPGGMERPTDSFKETNNLTLAQEDTLFGGLVSNLQVAELLAFMAQNRNLSYCKTVEVVAETTAPLTPMSELLVKIPSKRKIPSKQEELQKPEIPEASKTFGATPEFSKVTDEATILKEGELPKENLEEQDAITKPVEAETAKSLITEVPPDVTAKESVQDRSIQGTPLSPYTMYDDLKPPSSPCPSAPSGQGKQIEPDATESGTPDTSTSISETEADTAETVTVELQKVQPLSPYTAYEDLKPPSSPSPSSPGNSREESLKTSKTVDGVPQVIDGNGALAEDIQQELIFYHSPFPVYDDFKPPSSPCPSAPSGQIKQTEPDTTEPGTPDTSTSILETEADTAEITTVELQKVQPLSPYTAYEDLKPPTSPTPSAPNSLATSMASAGAESQMASLSNNGALEPVEAHDAEDVQTAIQPKPRPLSPYTMYDDMKPPSSPMPSPWNH